MKRVFVDEKWCLGCHLCEYYCAFANSGNPDMVKALKNGLNNQRIQIEGDNHVSFAVSCRHCEEPYCISACITGALSIDGGVVRIDPDRCVGCYTCILNCPYGAILPSSAGKENAAVKCELCIENSNGMPACVKGCINNAIIYEERD